MITPHYLFVYFQPINLKQTRRSSITYSPFLSKGWEP